MADYQSPDELLGLPNVTAVSYQLTSAERIEVCIESRLDAAVCPDCQQVSAQRHDTAEPQMLRDLAIWGRECWLRYAFGGPGALPAPPATTRLSNASPGANPAWRTHCGTPSIATHVRSMRISPRLRWTKG